MSECGRERVGVHLTWRTLSDLADPKGESPLSSFVRDGIGVAEVWQWSR
jgi:hypothetical protein